MKPENTDRGVSYKPPGVGLFPLVILAVIVAAYCEFRDQLRSRLGGEES